MELTIHTIAAATWTRYDKWRVELELIGKPKQVCWLTPAQYDYLTSAFSHTKNGYSDSRCTVIGEFSDDGKYYIRCKAVAAPPKPKHFTPLVGDEEVCDELLDAH